MTHEEQKQFCLSVKQKFTELFRNKRALVRKTKTLLRRIKNASAYVVRGDWRGLRERIMFYRKEAALTARLSSHANAADWGIVTPGRTLFVAHLLAESLQKNSFRAEIMTSVPQHCTHDIYVVLCPQAFDRLPPAERRIAFQTEPSISSQWFTPEYLNILKNSFAVVDCSLKNIDFLHEKNITYPRVHYVPVGASTDYGADDATVLACAASQKRFAFMFDRFLIATGFLPVTHVAELTLPLPTGADTFALSMPETVVRRRAFEKICPEDCAVFDGIVRRPGWIGCGLSYAALARHALQNGLKTITVMEDDVVLPPDYAAARKSIEVFLQSKNGEWDVFSGVIADLHADTVVSAVETFEGRTFVTVNKMTSMVYNIYAERTLRLFCEWNPNNDDAAVNTIDRYLESRRHLRVIVMLPYFVGHSEEVASTLWGFGNRQYSNMIAASEALLRRKTDDYLAERARAAPACELTA